MLLWLTCAFDTGQRLEANKMSDIVVADMKFLTKTIKQMFCLYLEAATDTDKLVVSQ